MKVYVFDLDDTLYNEITFVYSGFRAVAAYLSDQYGIPSESSFDLMCRILEEKGRGRVFDEVLEHYRIHGQRHVRKCLSVYRTHTPQISLLPDAETVLQTLSDSPTYIVTDGNKMVQHNKIQALGLYNRVKKCYITYRYGKHHSKPSPYCFQKIAHLEKADPSGIVYVGDNPNNVYAEA